MASHPTPYIDNDTSAANRVMAGWLNDVQGHVFSDTPISPATTVHTSSVIAFTPEGTGAVASDVQVKLRKIKHITDYGAATGNTGAVNTPLIQAAIDANYGKTLIIPPGTFNIATTGSVVAPVGTALTITDEITLIFEGILKGTNNCNCVHINAGSQDVVTLMNAGGGIQGYGTFFEATNRNGSLIKCTAGIPRIYQIKLIDPPQYSLISEGCDEGHISEVEMIGGQDTYPGDNNYGICLVDASLGWKIDGCKTLQNGSGGMVSQGVASITLGTGTADRTQILNNRFFNQWEKGTYMIADDVQIIGNFVYNNANGEGIRVVGIRPQVNDNDVRSCLGGGITLYDAQGAQCVGNTISNYRQSGITLMYAGAVAGKSLSDALIADNKISGTTTDSGAFTPLAAIDIRGDSAAGNIERRISVIGNEINTASYSTSDERAGIDIQPGAAGTTFQDLSVCNNIVNDSGCSGIRFRTGTYSWAKLKDNKVLQPNGNVATWGVRPGFRWDASLTWASDQIIGNEARENTGGRMNYGFSNNSSANIQTTLIQGNNTRGHTVAGYLNMQHATNSRFANRQGESTLTGSFTATAGATSVITNSNAQTGMRVALYPTNAAAVALQGHATGGLYFGGTISAGVNFTLASTGGVAAGTETFDYALDV